MPETKTNATALAKRLNYPASQITEAPDGSGYYLAPRGIRSDSAKRAYADLRSKGYSKESSARIAWTIEKKHRNK